MGCLRLDRHDIGGRKCGRSFFDGVPSGYVPEGRGASESLDGPRSGMMWHHWPAGVKVVRLSFVKSL